jgi:hypothetical protein
MRTAQENIIHGHQEYQIALSDFFWAVGADHNSMA